MVQNDDKASSDDSEDPCAGARTDFGSQMRFGPSSNYHRQQPTSRAIIAKVTS